MHGYIVNSKDRMNMGIVNLKPSLKWVHHTQELVGWCIGLNITLFTLLGKTVEWFLAPGGFL